MLRLLYDLDRMLGPRIRPEIQPENTDSTIEPVDIWSKRDIADQIYKYVRPDMKEIRKYSAINRIARKAAKADMDVVQRLYKWLTDDRQTNGRNQIKVIPTIMLRPAVKHWFVIIHDDVLVYRNIITLDYQSEQKGAMLIKMVDKVESEEECYTQVEIDGFFGRIKDPAELQNKIISASVDGSIRFRLNMVVRSQSETGPVNAFTPFLLNPGIPNCWVWYDKHIEMWQVHLIDDVVDRGFCMRGVIFFHGEEANMWCETEYATYLRYEDVVPEFHGLRRVWKFYYMKTGIGTSEQLKAIIRDTNWMNGNNSLAIMPKQTLVLELPRYRFLPEDEVENRCCCVVGCKCE